MEKEVIMRKVEGKGGQVEGGLTKEVEQNTIRLPLPPTSCHSKWFEGTTIISGNMHRTSQQGTSLPQ